MVEPYVTGLQLYPIPGAGNIFFTASATTATLSNGAPTTINYETATVPTPSQTGPLALVTGPSGNITTLFRNSKGYSVKEIGQSVTSNAASSSSTAATTITTTPGEGSITPSHATTSTGVYSSASTSELASRQSSTASHEEHRPPPTTHSNNKAATAVAGVMGGLFAITLVALLFLIFKLRKAKKDSFHSPPIMAFAEASAEKDQSPISELSAANMNLMSQLEERNAQLSALQATLMRSNSVPPSLDDRSIASRFKQVEQELKDWVIIHFKSTEQRLDLSPQLREILISQIPLFDRLLQQPKSRTLVLRAVAGHVIQKAFENGEFVGAGEGLGSLERSVGRNIPEAEFNKWRSQTFLIFSKASTAESKAHVVAAISQRIDSLLSPFSTTLDQQERLHFLYRIVESAAALSLDLGSQLAKFKVLSDPAETPFDSAHMEDVYQEHETQVDPHTGKSVNALDGKTIQAVVFPSVIKWGDERGENYEEMKVILKAKVLT